MPALATRVPWALLSAVLAALIAIFAKVGLEGIDSTTRRCCAPSSSCRRSAP